MAKLALVPTLGMQQHSAHADFCIRDQQEHLATRVPHRHEYFQIQINLGGDTVQHIGGAVRPFPHRAMACILPHRLHWIAHPPGGAFVLINFTPEFFLRGLHCDPLDLEELPASAVPELLPFLYQEHMDFILDAPDFDAVLALLAGMRAHDAARQLGSRTLLRGLLLQMLGTLCNRYAPEFARLADDRALRRGQRDAVGRVKRYLREHLANPALTLGDAAAAAFLSPNYLTHLLRKETGSTFSELVSGRRLRMARVHLMHGTESLLQIALACGYTDEAYFSRCFRKAYGMPPGTFRKQQQSS